jgi:hypothetical protein
VAREDRDTQARKYETEIRHNREKNRCSNYRKERKNRQYGDEKQVTTRQSQGEAASAQYFKL